MINLLSNFKSYIMDNDLLKSGDRVLLAVSGGVDSMVLLELFSHTGYNIGVAHCNFQLRGEESDEDEVLVEQWAKSHYIPYYNKRFETTAEMERTGESMEMAARRLRYVWFDELCDKFGYNAIAVAHHSDDSIETFFINLLRGTGVRGLSGIKHQSGRVIRPLSFATRKVITEYASANHIAYREDSSNRSTKYLRNKIRLGLVPQIKEINPKFPDLMRANIDRIRAAQIFINQSIEKISNVVMSCNDGIYTLDVEAIDADLPRDFVVYELLSSHFGFKSDVIDSLLRSLSNELTGRRFYSRENVAYVDRGKVVISAISSDDSCSTEVAREQLRSYCGNTMLLFDYMVIDLVGSLDCGADVALLDADKLTYPLTLRRWNEGDSFVPFGMEGRHKKVSDLLIDLKLSMPQKQRQFVLCSGEDIVWVVGRRIDDRYGVGDDTENVVKITREML